MNTVMWDCTECNTQNVVVLNDGENELFCRDCGIPAELVSMTEVHVSTYLGEIYSGG